MAKRKITKEHLRLVGLALTAIVLLIIFAQNLDQQTVQILFLKMTMPLAVMLIGTTLLGYLIGLLSAGVLGRRKRKGHAGTRTEATV